MTPTVLKNLTCCVLHNIRERKQGWTLYQSCRFLFSKTKVWVRMCIRVCTNMQLCNNYCPKCRICIVITFCFKSRFKYCCTIFEHFNQWKALNSAHLDMPSCVFCVEFKLIKLSSIENLKCCCQLIVSFSQVIRDSVFLSQCQLPMFFFFRKKILLQKSAKKLKSIGFRSLRRKTVYNPCRYHEYFYELSPHKTCGFIVWYLLITRSGRKVKSLIQHGLHFLQCSDSTVEGWTLWLFKVKKILGICVTYNYRVVHFWRFTK